MLYLPNVGEVLSFNAQVLPDKIGARDLTRAMTFKLWNERACRFANALRELGLSKGIASRFSRITAWSGWRFTPAQRRRDL